MKITITGDLYSGKSCLSKSLCSHYGLKIFSAGKLLRKEAESLGMDITEFNKYMDDNNIDMIIDERTREIGRNEENFLFDARLAWYFIEDSINIYLKVNEDIAAERAIKDARGSSETYITKEAALFSIKKRSFVERERFIRLYDADIYNLHNYDIIFDTSFWSREEVLLKVVESIELCRKNYKD
ncbi:cytidylate kinase family protein [Clostridium amazonitimonense]|uniref:cytidylate kinase family protein n=1 Tax=Clostridium amazonitimonense TaxID=1499689 RepID=UPI0005097043|nr:cytidylate kinase family protein [Clostridium amazonitimonense]